MAYSLSSLFAWLKGKSSSFIVLVSENSSVRGELKTGLENPAGENLCSKRGT